MHVRAYVCVFMCVCVCMYVQAYFSQGSRLIPGREALCTEVLWQRRGSMLEDLQKGQCACDPGEGKAWQVGPQPGKASEVI